MVDLVAADVTVTIEERTIVAKKRRNRVKIAFGNGTLTYPSGGVPMPAAATFGMVRNLDYLTVFDENDASGITWKYDKEGNKLRAYVQGVTLDAAGAGVLDDFPVSAGFGVTASRSMGFVGAAAGANKLGVLHEATAASDAPAAQVLYAEAVGW